MLLCRKFQLLTKATTHSDDGTCIYISICYSFLSINHFFYNFLFLTVYITCMSCSIILTFLVFSFFFFINLFPFFLYPTMTLFSLLFLLAFIWLPSEHLVWFLLNSYLYVLFCSSPVLIWVCLSLSLSHLPMFLVRQ